MAGSGTPVSRPTQGPQDFGHTQGERGSDRAQHSGQWSVSPFGPISHFTDRETEAQRAHTMNYRQAVVWGWQPRPSMVRARAAPQIWAPQLRALLALTKDGGWMFAALAKPGLASLGSVPWRATGSGGHRDPGFTDIQPRLLMSPGSE